MIVSRFFVGLSVGLAFSATSAGSLADETPELVSLTYESPPECPDREDFLGRVRTRTDKFTLATTPSAAARVFEITVTDGDPSVGTLHIMGGESLQTERSVEGGDCDEVVTALALFAALAVDPGAGLPEEPAQTPKTAEPTPPAQSPAQPQPRAQPRAQPDRQDGHEPEHEEVNGNEPDPVRDRGTTSALSVGITGQVVWGATPEPLLGPGLSVALERNDWWFRLGLEQGWAAPTYPEGARLAFSRSVLRAGVCPLVLSSSSWQAAPCLHAVGGVLRAESSEIPRATKATRPVASVGAAAVLRWTGFEPWVVEISPGADLALVRDEFEFQPSIVVYEPPIVSGFFELGLSYRWQ